MPSSALSAAPLTPVTPAASHASPTPDVALPTGRPWHQRFNRWSRRLGSRLLNRHAAPGDLGAWPPAAEVRRILVIRVNYRLGNIVLLTALLPALRSAYPNATIDVLVGAGPAPLLAEAGFGRIFPVARELLRHPRQAVRLLRELRAARYDLALDGALGSFSGSLYAWAGRARHRVGARGRADRLLTVALDRPPQLAAYATGPFLASRLGITTAQRPHLDVSPARRADAAAWLATLPDAPPATPLTLGVFVGGHHEKRWPENAWESLITALATLPHRTLVFIGPEESHLTPQLTRLAHGPVLVVPPQSLARFTALVAGVDLLITPDSGPLHLAAALDVPVLALLQHPRSLAFVPPGTGHRILMRPDASTVMRALRSHPLLSLMTAPTADAANSA